MARAVVFFIRKAIHVQQISLLTPTEANSGVYQKSDSIMLPEMFFFVSAQLASPSTFQGECIFLIIRTLLQEGLYLSHKFPR